MRPPAKSHLPIRRPYEIPSGRVFVATQGMRSQRFTKLKVRGVPLVPTIIRGRIYGLFHWGYYDTSCKVKPRKYKRTNSGLIYCSQVWSFLRRALTGPTATIIRNFRFGGESHSLHAQCVVAARDDERNLDLLDVRCITEWASVCWDAKSKSFVKNQI